MVLKARGLTAEPAKPPKHILINGKKIKFRTPQSALWGLVATTLTVAFWAAVYYGGTQKGIFFAKSSWDGLFPYSWWPNYRHGLRNVGEPVLAAMVVHSFIYSGWKKHAETISGLRLAAHVVVSVLSAFVLIILGVTIIDYVLPSSVTSHSANTVVAGTLNYSFLIAFAFSFIVVHFVRFVWAPVGNAIAGGITDIAVRRANGKLPVWVRKPLAPPTMRERFVWTQQTTTARAVHTGSLTRWLVGFAGLAYLALAAWGEYILRFVAKGH